MNIVSLNFPLDYIVIIITLLFVIFSSWKGLIQSILGFFTWVGSIFIAYYFYPVFSNYLENQLLKIKVFQNFEILSNLLSVIIAIPIIFLLSLFILKRIRKIISSDLDKQILGILVDKILGIVFGALLSYFIFSTVMFSLNKFNLNNLNNWIINNSEILNTMNNINEVYIYKFIPKSQIEEL